MVRRIAQDVGALVARVAVGAVFLAHGWQKYQKGHGELAQSFADLGIPMPEISALFALVAELGGGGLLILGLLTPLASLALVVVMAGAAFYVHLGNGLLLSDGGYEYVLTLGGLCLLLAVTGAGRLSLDYLVFGKRGGSLLTGVPERTPAPAEAASAGTPEVKA
ncbi:DoxX family protein [Rhizohabitans arisaemae]|uniref:DoxX family protein n=1 Tax=Rhizohabitans arisaemae TaxID=2720610 RepID=UPI0024B24351|nr:DoxX family protein [Rhizohabitans arisaemae]